jgi:hypothetical protein
MVSVVLTIVAFGVCCVVFVVGTGLCESGGESCDDDVVDSEIVLVSESELCSVLFCCSDSVVGRVSRL